MASPSTDGIVLDLEAIGEHVDLVEVFKHLPAELIVEAVGLPAIIDVIGAERMLLEALKLVPAEQVENCLRRQQKSAPPPDGGEAAP
jgi:hypothetical protein